MDELKSDNPAAANSDGPGQELDGLILGVIGDADPISTDERRVRQRFPICCKMRLTPIDDIDGSTADDCADVFGKDLSLRGICFSHDFPLLQGLVAISLTHPVAGQFHVEAEVVWTRRTPLGLFESGCRLVRKIAGHNISVKS